MERMRVVVVAFNVAAESMVVEEVVDSFKLVFEVVGSLTGGLAEVLFRVGSSSGPFVVEVSFLIVYVLYSLY